MQVFFKDGNSAGFLVITSAAEATGIDCVPLINRHLAFDHGDMSEEDIEQNKRFYPEKGMMMSSYTVGKETIWVITDPGHEVTTILLPSDY